MKYILILTVVFMGASLCGCALENELNGVLEQYGTEKILRVDDPHSVCHTYWLLRKLTAEEYYQKENTKVIEIERLVVKDIYWVNEDHGTFKADEDTEYYKGR